MSSPIGHLTESTDSSVIPAAMAESLNAFHFTVDPMAPTLGRRPILRLPTRPSSISWSIAQSCPSRSTSENLAIDSESSPSRNSETEPACSSLANGNRSPSAYSERTSKTLCDHPRVSHTIATARPTCPPPAMSMCGIGSMTSIATVTRPPHRLSSGVASSPFASL